MRKLHIRVFLIVKLLVFLCVIAFCIRMAAPGFTFYGTKVVDLKYDNDLIINGGYPSIWRLHFDRINVTTRDPDKIASPLITREGRHKYQEIPLALDYPLAVILHGIRYNIGELTPDTILAMGGSVFEYPYGDKSSGLLVGPASNPQAIQIHIAFCNDRPYFFGCYALTPMPDPMVAALSYRGGPPLRLPATEKDIIKAFGPPQHRDARVVIPDKRNQPLLQTTGNL